MKKPYTICKILIPIDFSNTSMLALDHAAHICETFGSSSLYLLHVLKDSSVDLLPNVKGTNLSSNNTKEVKDLVIDELNSIGKKFSEKYNLNYQVEVRHGSIAKEINKVAAKVEADLVVMGTHGVSGYQEFFLGSNAFRVVTSATMPVLTVQCDADQVGYNNIVLPIDSSKRSREKVAQAAAIATAYNAVVHIVAVITKRHKKEESIYKLKVKQVAEYLADKGVKHTTKIIHGKDIADMTISFAKEIQACLTIIMTEQEDSSGFFMGPYAQRIVNHSEVPILSVTPKKVAKKFIHNNSYHSY